MGWVPAFDLVIADEADRCAGPVSSDFATILDLAAIKAHRRLFMTATPRYFTGKVIREAKEADFEYVSMDDEEKFGIVFHRLGFSDAINRGLLTDYQVAVIGVDHATYREWAERGTLVTLDGQTPVDARTLAGQIGLAKAMRKYHLRRTISFHSRGAGRPVMTGPAADRPSTPERKTLTVPCCAVPQPYSLRRTKIMQTWNAVDEHRKRGEAAIEKARALAEKAEAEGRAFAPDEQAAFDQALAEGRECVASIKARRTDQEFLHSTNALAAELGLGGSTAGAGGSVKGRRISFKGMAGPLAHSIAPQGAKALAPSGSAVVAQEFQGDPIPLGRVPQGLLDVLPVKVHATPEYAYVAQTERSNAAAVVAEGAVKPTSVLGLTRVEKSLAVLATLSEPTPRFWIQDTVALEAFINAELEHCVSVALEAKVLADTVNTSGAQAQDYSVSVLQTIRKALTKVKLVGLAPGSIVLHPSDFEGIELALASATAVEHLNLPYDSATKRLFGTPIVTPIVTTVSATPGVGVVLAQDAVVLDLDSYGLQVMWSETAGPETFSRNEIVCRCEMRANSSQLSPLGIVVADLAA